MIQKFDLYFECTDIPIKVYEAYSSGGFAVPHSPPPFSASLKTHKNQLTEHGGTFKRIRMYLKFLNTLEPIIVRLLTVKISL